MDKFKYKEYKNNIFKYNKKISFLSFIRLIIFLLIVICFFIGSSIILFNYIACFLIILFILFVFIHDRYYKLFDYYSKWILIADSYKDRKNGKWNTFSDTGIDFSNVMLSDLNVVGDNSLYQYLTICKTVGGRKKLIDKLSNNKISNNELLKSQEMIKELSCDIDFIMNFQIEILNNYHGDFIDYDDGFKYLFNKSKSIIILLFGIFFSLICLSLLFLGIFDIISYSYFYVMFIINFLVNYIYSYFYKNDFSRIDISSSLYGGLFNIYKIILDRNFSSKKMNDIYNGVFECYYGTKKLMFINEINNLKNNILSSFIFNGLFSVNIIVRYLYFKFLNDYSSVIKRGVSYIYELEAMISLAGMGIVRDDVCMPSYVNNTSISFKDIKHPLFDVDAAIGNDFDSSYGVNIITGSNMGGKTSFLRTIGINLILMNAGCYVCATYFKSDYFKIFTSISINDDISKGISTFYEELIRIRDATFYEGGNRIILIDEIFKGTNYNDRIYGAKEIIKKLNDKKTILFITTHDFELCNVSGVNINNYYFEESYSDEDINFDYKIKKGRCNSTNARYLMMKLGIID